MSDRFSYSNPWAGGNEPWFRVGRVDVTTTVALISLGISCLCLSILVSTFFVATDVVVSSAKALAWSGSMYLFISASIKDS